MVKIGDYNMGEETAWCPGCGNFGIVAALKQALVELDLAPHQVLLVSGVGQAGKLPHYLKCNTLNTLHGRTLPTATAAKLANGKLTVIAVGGDGDGFAEGGNHFLHATRKNVDITYLVHENRVFGLTKGQASPTSNMDMITGTTPHGVVYESFNPMGIAITQNAGFVARSFSANRKHLVEMIKAAIQHPGFALVDIFQPCVTFNKLNTYQWFRDRLYELEAEYDPTDRFTAYQRTFEFGEKIPIGVFYKTDRPHMGEFVKAIQDTPLVEQPLDPHVVDPFLDLYRVQA